MVEAAFVVPLLPVPQTGWRLLDHYYGLDIAALVLRQFGLCTAQKMLNGKLGLKGGVS